MKERVQETRDSLLVEISHKANSDILLALKRFSNESLDNPMTQHIIRQHIRAIVAYYRDAGIQPTEDSTLEISFIQFEYNPFKWQWIDT